MPVPTQSRAKHSLINRSLHSPAAPAARGDRRGLLSRLIREACKIWDTTPEDIISAKRANMKQADCVRAIFVFGRRLDIHEADIAAAVNRDRTWYKYAEHSFADLHRTCRTFRAKCVQLNLIFEDH